ncbi:type VII secretion protein EsaA [Bacillus canaveralius]|uniref:Type VII secretion protein EsaA n=1 Tax=Bacillus canaveralius TaxID=1403243 RepID=A0A2N5GN21_9BACI|nr:type VII secretion protein EsaA [Bacillus canaveralius]PLR83445.1 type VII secretion protein EsaA [Bacillus canaveralius]PLR95374.1 type VII secretion protein EsaA [Bacillus canaveralius]
MTWKTKYIVKMIFIVFLIFSTPAVFFGSVGDNELQERANATRTIAVVNEDTGADKEDRSLEFGKEISNILAEDSDFDWTVLSRSAAVNGLENTKYDAVVFIPSDFSRNIMSYEEQQPVKAKFEYTVQDQLNVFNREKVLREIEQATSRVNGKVSTLYWSYISQDLENVRSKFDEILQKEIDFQNAMLAFYKPSSQNLAGEIEQQRNMLEAIQSTMRSTVDSSPQRENNVKQFEQNLAAFVKYVEDYQEYQDLQQQTLQKAQDQNITSIQNASTAQSDSSGRSKQLFEQNTQQLSVNMGEINEDIKENNEMIKNLSLSRSEQVKEQPNHLVAYINSQDSIKLKQLEDELLQIKSELNTGSGYGNSSSILDLQAEIDELTKIHDEVIALKTSLEQEPEPENQIIEDLGDWASRINILKTNLETKNTGDNNPLKPIVQNKEQLIFGLENLPANNKLSNIFGITINSNDLVKNLKYYSLLEQYESTLKGMLYDDSENKLQFLNDINEIVAMNPDEQKAWETLNTELPSTEAGMTALEGTLQAFMTEYGANLDKEQKIVQDDLKSIEETASSVLKQIQNPTHLLTRNVPRPDQGADGTVVVSSQKSISQEMLSINELMTSLGESQGSIVTYTDELQSQVQNVQADADKLNEKWGTNVATTQLFRDDIFGVLGNAYVDGQQNGPVYEYLSQPLQISGDGSSKEEEEKKVPPVVILAIVLLSSLLIGYFSHYFKGASILVQGSMFVLLNLIVGLIISLFGLNIYPLGETRAIEWSIFTILLLATASTLVLVSFKIGNLIGWVASVALVAFFITPLLALAAPNFQYEDQMSKVYMSIQYGSSALFIPAIIVLAGTILFLSIIPFAFNALKNARAHKAGEEAHEA